LDLDDPDCRRGPRPSVPVGRPHPAWPGFRRGHAPPSQARRTSMPPPILGPIDGHWAGQTGVS
jgi:hypothetical protein